jgi:hypothetical protein
MSPWWLWLGFREISVLVIEQNAYQRCVYVPKVHWPMPTLNTRETFTSEILNTTFIDLGLDYFEKNDVNSNLISKFWNFETTNAT